MQLRCSAFISDRRRWSVSFSLDFFSSFSQILNQLIDPLRRIRLISIFDRLDIFFFFPLNLFKLLRLLLSNTNFFSSFLHIRLNHRMPLISFSDLSYILIDLSIEDIETTIFLNFMSTVDIMLNCFFILTYLFLKLGLLISNLFFSRINLSFDCCRCTFGLGIDKLDIRILTYRTHILIVVILQLIFQVDKRSVFLLSTCHSL